MWLEIAALLAIPTTRSGIIVFMKKVEKTSNDATHAERSASDEDALQALVPYMRTESHAAGEMLFSRGDPRTS